MKITALRTLFVFVERGGCATPYQFDNDLFNRIVLVAICKGLSKDVMQCFKTEFVAKYDDIRYYMMKFIHKVGLHLIYSTNWCLFDYSLHCKRRY